MAATQEALYQEHDLELSWSEASLPERERTKHVHRLHPYLGKFIPQLVETLLDRHVPAGGRVLDPVRGLGHDARAGARVRATTRPASTSPAFNALLARVKTRPYNLEALRRDLLLGTRRGGSLRAASGGIRARHRHYVRAVVRAARPPRSYCTSASLVEQVGSADVLRDRARPLRPLGPANGPLRPRVPPRASARALLVPQAPARVQARSRRPAGSCCATRSTRSSGSRRSSAVRADGYVARVLHGDARAIDLEGPYDGAITSPPYPGLIASYHEQHRYAYELLGVDERGD